MFGCSYLLAYNIVYSPEPVDNYRVQEADDTDMGTLELSLRYPTGVHIGVEPETQYDDRLMESEHDDDKWGIKRWKLTTLNSAKRPGSNPKFQHETDETYSDKLLSVVAHACELYTWLIGAMIPSSSSQIFMF